MFLSEWRKFPSAPCLAEKRNLTARVSMLLKSRGSLTCFRACFLSGQAKDLSAPRYKREELRWGPFFTIKMEVCDSVIISSNGIMKCVSMNVLK